MSMICSCGARMYCVDSRTADNVTRRRYRCDCGQRASSTENLDGVPSDDYQRGLADGEARVMAAVRKFAQAAGPLLEGMVR